MRLAHAVHTPILRASMDHKGFVVGFALVALVVAFAMIAPYLGTEFIPSLPKGRLRSTSPPGRHRPGGVDPDQHTHGEASAPTFPTRSSTCGAASAPPRSPPTQWESK